MAADRRCATRPAPSRPARHCDHLFEEWRAGQDEAGRWGAGGRAMTRSCLLCRAYMFEITYKSYPGRGARVGSPRLFLSRSDSALQKVPAHFRSHAAPSDRRAPAKDDAQSIEACAFGGGRAPVSQDESGEALRGIDKGPAHLAFLCLERLACAVTERRKLGRATIETRKVSVMRPPLASSFSPFAFSLSEPKTLDRRRRDNAPTASGPIHLPSFVEPAAHRSKS